MKIVFTHSYFLRLDPKQWVTGQPYPPLGTLYAAAVLRENGFDVQLQDAMFLETPEQVLHTFATDPPDIFVIYDDGFNYLTKMCLTNMRNAAFHMATLAKSYGCKVIVAGSDASDHFDSYLSQGCDFVLIGEAEMSLLELVQQIAHNETDFTSVNGIAYRVNGVTMKTRKREIMRDLDALPMPAWDLLDISPYRKMWQKSSGYFSLNVATTRGCPFKCNWCAKPIYGNRYHARSPQHVFRELVYLKEHFGYDHIWFCDDIFGLKPGWVTEFSQLVKEAGLQFRFKIQSRADLLVQDAYISALAAAGCENVWIGAESGSQKILDAMDKGITTAQIAQATVALKQHGIQPSFFIQFGYPGETRRDIDMTIRMINTLLPHSIGISVAYPLPGTRFYENVRQELSEKANWTDSNDLHLMFRNQFAPEFYRRLHRYVHQSHRRHMAMQQWRQLFTHPGKANIAQLKKAVSFLYRLPAEILAAMKMHRYEKNIA